MSHKLFVARLPWTVGRDSLRSYFSKFGEVTDAVVITDRGTGRSKGFGFVTLGPGSNIDAVINEQHEMEGRAVIVSKARETPFSSSGGSGEGRPSDGGYRGDRGDRGDRGERGDRGSRPPRVWRSGDDHDGSNPQQ